jgi:hypothetical protein
LQQLHAETGFPDLPGQQAGIGISMPLYFASRQYKRQVQQQPKATTYQRPVPRIIIQYLAA